MIVWLRILPIPPGGLRGWGNEGVLIGRIKRVYEGVMRGDNKEVMRI